MDFSEVVPRYLHPMLAWLGKIKEPWLDIVSDEADRSIFEVRNDALERQPGATQHISLLKEVLSRKRGGNVPNNALLLAYFDAASYCLAYGPKIFQPTVEQFDSMQHVDINIPIKDYRQPYPALVVRIPNESRKALAANFKLEAKRCPHLDAFAQPLSHGRN